MDVGTESGYEILAGLVQYNAVTWKRINRTEASYILEGTVLENVDSIKHLGVTIRHDLRWNTHISNMCPKANRTLGFLI